ncbi:putative transcription factor C2H2 family [Lupinus albus]|uniref:Putative transcription factor C2H2 family n=1 Tax=Lupinus albus TaxID=3870 RepID=A0A6A4N4Q8_LUPAL|nr:putative transcription factor C2H2 family [Lupinus albus]
MNCLVGCHSHMWIVTIVFYTCILIPLMQLKRLLSSMFCVYDMKGVSKEIEFPQIPSLPVARFEDLRETEEICSICLVDFEGEDAVSKIKRCGHVFHVNCIQQWLHLTQYSCPLCRSSLFS